MEIDSGREREDVAAGMRSSTDLFGWRRTTLLRVVAGVISMVAMVWCFSLG